MAVVTEHMEDSLDLVVPASRTRMRLSRKWILLTLIALLLGIGFLVRGRGAVTRLVRIVYPDYRVAQYPPKVMTTSPGDGDVGVAVASVVSADLRVARAGFDPKSINSDSVFLFRTGDQKLVPASVGLENGQVVLKPDQPLDPLTNYTFYVTSGVKDAKGRDNATYASTFTTAGKPDESIGFKRALLSNTKGNGVTALRIGPDKTLWAGTDSGKVMRYPINADGTLGQPQVIDSLQKANKGPRLLIGFDFDKSSTAENPIIWVTNSYFAFTDVPDFTGKVTRMSGPNLDTVEDAVINLPRSIKDHQTMQPSFGPDGALYFSQASNTAMGAPDQDWGFRKEHMLNACILRLDTTKLTPGKPLDAKTPDCGGLYDPSAPDAALTIYATGVRLGYDLVWHSNGNLYVPTNGSDKGGNTPSAGGVAGLKNVPIAEDDWLFKIDKGKYYGHPNPVEGHFVLNGGNPTAQWDRSEVIQYPVGTQPESGWQPAAWDIGRHVSADGAIEYRSNSFGGKLKGKLLICRYNWGSDLLAIDLDAQGKVRSATSGFAGTTNLQSPLDITEDPATGNLYVSEYGAQRITLLRPIVAN